MEALELPEEAVAAREAEAEGAAREEMREEGESLATRGTAEDGEEQPAEEELAVESEELAVWTAAL